MSMTVQPKKLCSVAIAKWTENDGMAQDIFQELEILGHSPTMFLSTAVIPRDAEVVLTFAPWGRFLPLASQIGHIPSRNRPILLHWNLENPADLAIPWPILSTVARFRSWVDRLNDAEKPALRSLVRSGPLRLINGRMTKYRYIGEYYYAHRMGWMPALAETSSMFAKFHTEHGLPTFYVGWGTSPNWYQKLDLDRDIDVLWMGKRRTRRRSNNIEKIRQRLASDGLVMHIADGVENPLVYGDERTRLISRSKITVNVMQNWYDNSFHMRFHMVAGNRSLVVSEHLPPHYREYVPGTHYVSADVDAVPDTILYYLKHEDERREIAENAYELVATQLTFASSVGKLMDLAHTIRQDRTDLHNLAVGALNETITLRQPRADRTTDSIWSTTH